MAHLGVMEGGRVAVRFKEPMPRRRQRAVMQRAIIRDLPPLTAEQGTHLHYVQQMLVAAVLASGAIVTVAAVMILRLF